MTASLTTPSGVTLTLLVARSFWSRLRGLMGYRSFSHDQGLLFPNANSIHMFFMNFAIDVAFLEKPVQGSARIKSLRTQLRPWTGLAWSPSAWGTLELAAGSIERLGLKIGQDIQLSGKDVANF